MKKAVILLAGLLTVLSMGFASAQFSDVPAGHWAKEAVEALASQGIILGFPDGTFRGNENLTRYQAAMIIYRLLQKIQPGQVSSMDKETLTALRNAVQELAAELASLGVRVSALEDNAATKGDVARLEKMIADLKASAPAPAAGNSAAVKDLADRVEAAAIAADTALAQVQALQGKVDAMGAQVSANSDSIKALNELSVMLNQDVLSLQDRVTALEKAGTGAPVNLAGVASKGDVQAVRDYVTAIRGDLVNVSNKVSALEEKVSDLEAGLGKTNARIDELSSNVPVFSGSLSAKYFTSWGNSFDIDALGATLGDDDATTGDLGYQEGKFSTKLGVSFNIARNGSSDPNGLNVQSVGLSFSDIDTLGGPSLGPAVFGIGDATTYKVNEGGGTKFSFIDRDANGKPSAGDYILTQSVTPVFPADFVTLSSGNGLYWMKIASVSSAAGDDVTGITVVAANGGGVVAIRGDVPPVSGSPSFTDEHGFSLSSSKYYKVADVTGSGIYLIKAAVANNGIWTVLDGVTSSFSIGKAPIEMTFAKLPKFKFTEYIADNDASGYGPGLLVNISGLPLGTSLQAVTVSQNSAGADDGTGGDDDYLHGARLTLAPMKDFSVGASYVMHNNPTLSGGTESIYGFDANAKLGSLILGGEYAADSGGTSLYYVKGGATLGPVTLNANYRNVGPSNFVSNDGIQGDDNSAPFKNEKGFGVDASAKIAFLSIGATYDSFTEVNGAKGSKAMIAGATDDALSETAWKATVGADLFAGFSLEGYYGMTTDTDTAGNINWSHDNNDGFDDTSASGTASFSAVAETAYGITLKNSGLIDGLSFEGYFKSASYAAGGTFGKTSMGGKIDFATKLATLNTKIYANYDKTSYSTGTTFSDVLYAAGIDHAGTNDDVATINAGASIDTDPFGIVFKPSLMASVDYHSGSHSRLNTFTASDLKWCVGLALNEFLTEHSKFTVKYMSRASQNFNVVSGKDFNGASYQASGYELGWNYYDLQITYGSYNSGSNSGSAFKVSYAINF